MPRIATLIIVFSLTSSSLFSQDQGIKTQMTLEDVINLASDSSLNAFIAQNMYLANYWEYRNYRAQRLPFLTLNAAPANFSRSLTQQYNFQDSSYQYVGEQTFNSSANLSLSQNITRTGGRVYIDSDLMRLENIRSNTPVQFSSTMVRIGVSQELFGFNPFKWESRIEPIKYEKAKRELVSTLEGIAVTAVEYFFDMAKAQVNFEIARSNLANSDTLYQIGQQRYQIASISQEDLYTLQLNVINSTNELRRAEIELKRARINLYSLLRLPAEVDIELIYPEQLPGIHVNPSQGLSLALENNPNILAFAHQLLESQREVERARKESRLNATLNASFGLNQMGNSVGDAYRNPMDQEMVRLSISIPLLDWGLARGRYNLAQKNLEVMDATLQQSRIDFEHNILMTIEEFNLQEDMVKGAAQADTIAHYAYEIARRRFINGNIQLTQLNAVHSNTIAARRAYITTLENYWRYYYTIRRLTLYDFSRNQTLFDRFNNLFGM